MKKFVSLLLVFAMLLAVAVPAFAGTDGVDVTTGTLEDLDKITGSEYPIVFVTGIGQTWTHLVNEDGSYKTDADGDIIEYNLIYPDFNLVLGDMGSILNLLLLVGEILGTIVLDTNLVKKDHVSALLEKLFYYNIIDEKGNLPAEVEDVTKPFPISKYNEIDLDNFYRSIPCQEMAATIGTDNIFCYNYSAFSFTFNNADGLDKFINEILDEYSDADKVVLIPMSMGASVVNAYLANYGHKAQVKRVVGIVGAWNGSSVFADLLEGRYAEDAPEILYNRILQELVGEPWGYLINVLIRLMPKSAARGLIDEALEGLKESLMYKTPSLLALIPWQRYERIEQNILCGDEYAYIREQTRPYYEIQKNLKNIMKDLEEKQGVEFYFITGYGLEFGGFSSDYLFFRFMESAVTTNSDEIIEIASSAPGTTFAPAGQKLTKDCYASDADYAASQAKYISPDGGIDVSTAFYPDRTWCFYKQKHELEYNNTALKIALGAALGEFDSVDDVKDVYPQFNGSRDVKSVVRGDHSYLNLLKNYINENPTGENTALAQTTLDALNAMLDRTINDREADDKIIEDANQALITIGVFDAPSEPEWHEELLNKAFKSLNDTVYDIFGAKGFRDLIWEF